MKIKKLEIVGFKSFVEQTIVHFDHDVTGIVGPNGCGKSNVVDAIKWVMGEQSPSRLRGKAMDDVIFNGSESRGPHGFAEVSITFDNTDGLTPPEYRDYAEIQVTRRLDRSGRSDYSINRTPVRLMDITNLFLGTGVGRRAYSIIEQGRIGFIVSSKPADRRGMIEEAAGITKFKVRKRAAERKMDQTRQNLVRIGDILGELEKSLSSLKRQAQKAERYTKYRDEVRDLELYVASFKWFELDGTLRMIRGSLHTEQAQEEGARLGLRVREAEVEVERLGVQSLGDAVESDQNRAYELDNRVRVLEGQIQQFVDRLTALREREDLAERELSELVQQRESLEIERASLAAALHELEEVESQAKELFERENAELERRRLAIAEAERAVNNARARVGDAETRRARAEAVLAGFERRRAEGRERLTGMRTQKEQLEQKVIELGQERDSFAIRMEALRSGKAQTSARRDEVQAELDELRRKIRESDADLQKLRDHLAEKRSRLRSLREVQQRFEGVGAGVRALMTHYAGDDESRRARGVVGLVADRLQVPAEWTEALAGALGDRLQEIVVEDPTRALEAAQFLAEQQAGRATLVPRRPRRTAGARRPLPQSEGVLGRLADLVESAPEDETLVRHLLGEFVVVEDLATALRLHRAGVEDVLVTRSGELLAPDGTFTGGAGDEAGAHLLSMKREIRQLETQVAELDATLGDAVTLHGELRRGIAQRQAEIDAARTEAHDAEIAIVKAEKDLRRADEEGKATSNRAIELGDQIDSLATALDEAGEEEASAKEEIAEARQAGEDANQELDAAQAIYGERKASVEEQNARVTELRVRAAQARERAESDRGALERLTRSVEELDNREARLRGDVLESAQEQGRVTGELYGARETMAVALGQAMEARDQVARARARFESARQVLGDSEVGIKQLRERVEHLGRSAQNLALQEREFALELTHLLEQVQERHRVDVRHVLCDYHARPLPTSEIKQRVSELLRLIERMGQINLLAIEEYDEKSTRYEYLKGQDEDLQQALRTLDKAIREMNRESKRMFKEAFVAINERFKRIFPELFRGGSAELKLSDPNDILESGIEIVAQPPGKRLGSLELMSGGEKALTAVAMIFAIFQYKPSPFCLLDEVDAPLDEANISRFAQAIRQMTDRSQFIVITHSKRTMEYTDVLYGVTMQEPGISSLVSVELRGEQRPLPEKPDADVAVA